MSLSPAAVEAVRASGMDVDGSIVAAAPAAAALNPFFLDCQNLNGRFELLPGRHLQYNSVVLSRCRCACMHSGTCMCARSLHDGRCDADAGVGACARARPSGSGHTPCRTLSTAGFITKRPGSALVFNNTVDDQGSVCVPLPLAQGFISSLPRQPGTPAMQASLAALQAVYPAGGSATQQYTALAPAGSSWCTAAGSGAAFNGSSSQGSPLLLAPQLLPTLILNASGYALCQQPALLAGNTA
jgi:hypothetical protein